MTDDVPLGKKPAQPAGTAFDFFAAQKRAAPRGAAQLTNTTKGFFWSDPEGSRALPLGREATFGQRKFGGYSERHDVTITATGFFSGTAPSRHPAVDFAFDAYFEWDLTDPAAWARNGREDLTKATIDLLTAQVGKHTLSTDPRAAATAGPDIELRLRGAVFPLPGPAGSARLTGLTLRVELPSDPAVEKGWTFDRAELQTQSEDGVPFTVGLSFAWRVADPLRWRLERVDEPAQLCREVLGNEIGLVLASYPHHRATDAQEAARGHLGNRALNAEHGLEVELRSLRVALDATSRPVDITSHSEQYETKLPTNNAAVPFEATIAITWQVSDQARWARSPLENPLSRCQFEANQRLLAVTSLYTWEQADIAQRYINEQICPNT